MLRVKSGKLGLNNLVGLLRLAKLFALRTVRSRESGGMSIFGSQFFPQSCDFLLTAENLRLQPGDLRGLEGNEFVRGLLVGCELSRMHPRRGRRLLLAQVRLT